MIGHDRRPFRLVIATVLIVSMHGALRGGEAENACGPHLLLWETLGAAEPHRDWTARYLDAERDRATFFEVTIRFGGDGLPPEEARWFDAPKTLEAAEIFVTTTPCNGECVRTACDELLAAGLGELRAKASTRCKEITLKTVSTGETKTELERELTTVTVTNRRQGLFIDPTETTGRAACAEDEGGSGRSPSRVNYHQGRIDVESSPEPEGGGESSRGAGACLSKGGQILARLSQMKSPIVTGLPSLPTARGILEEIRTLDPNAVPTVMPDEFLMASAVGPRDYVQALAMERIRFGGGRPEQFTAALRVLGDRPSPAATDLLVTKLRFLVEAKHPGVDASLVVRALLAANTEEARRQAVPLLLDPGFARSALGVFALTEPKLKEPLERVNLKDATAVHDACEETLRYLASGADAELQALATAALGR